MIITKVTTTDTQKVIFSIDQECSNFEGTDTNLHLSIWGVSLIGRSYGEGDNSEALCILWLGEELQVSQHLAPVVMLLCNVLTLWTITSTKQKWVAIQSLLPPLSLLYLHDLATFVKLPKNSGIHFCSAKCYHPSQKDICPGRVLDVFTSGSRKPHDFLSAAGVMLVWHSTSHWLLPPTFRVPSCIEIPFPRILYS